MADYLMIDPDEDLDYVIDWSDWLASGDTISTSTWTITPSGPTLDNDSSTDTTATTFVSGATRGRVYTLTNQVVTTSNRTAHRSITLRCEER